MPYLILLSEREFACREVTGFFTIGFFLPGAWHPPGDGHRPG
ncbi:MAG: hypothetical protein AB1331_01100 [Bacillota bacterium]